MAREDVYNAKQDIALSVPIKSGVLTNDQDADGDELIAALINPPEKGLLNFNTDGSFTYTPVAGFLGTVTFTYRAYDGELFSGITQVRIVISDARQTFLPLLQRGF